MAEFSQKSGGRGLITDQLVNHRSAEVQHLLTNDRHRLAEIRRVAAAYPPEAQYTPRWEREAYLTELQQIAWAVRFESEPVSATALATSNRKMIDV